MKGTPPVSDTDVCLISTTLKEDNTAYILSTSVDSHLVPDVLGFRTKIDLQGFALRRLDYAPVFEPKAVTEVEGLGIPSRPSHKRNQSSASIGLFSSLTLSGENSIRSASNSVSTPAGTPFLSVVPSLPASKRSSTCKFFDSFSRLSIVHYLSSSFFSVPLYTLKSANTDQESSTRPGVHISLIVLASPSINLPASYSADLATKIPLSIASLNRYLSTLGFAPYIIRKEPRIELDVLEEKFDANEMKFRVVFRVHTSLKEENTKIRFFGNGFNNGRFEVKISRVRGWNIQYDTEPDKEPEVFWNETGGGIGQDEFSKASGRKTTLTVLNSTSTTRLDYFHRTPTTSAPSSVPIPSSTITPSTPSYLDPALRSGPLGGCTIIIPNQTIAGGPPIVVTISKSSITSITPLNNLKSTSRALGFASKKVGESVQNESIEEFLRSGTKEGRAEGALKGTREVLRLLREAREEEKKEGEQEGMFS